MQDNKNKDIDKKCFKGNGLAALGIASIAIVTSTLFSLFGSLYRYEIKNFLWPLSIIILIVDLLFWILPDKEELPEKNKRMLKNYRIIFLVIGGILFIINSFVFIKKIIYSCMLVTIVLFVFIGFIAMKKSFK